VLGHHGHPGSTTSMLNYQTTSFHDALTPAACCGLSGGAPEISKRFWLARNGKFSRTAQAIVLYDVATGPFRPARLASCHGGKPMHDLHSTLDWRPKPPTRRQNSTPALYTTPGGRPARIYRMRRIGLAAPHSKPAHQRKAV